MRTTRRHAATLLCASAALSLGLRPADTPGFDPAAGSVVEKRFRSELRVSFESMSSTFDGQPVPAQYLPEMEIEHHRHTSCALLDTYVAVADGVPTELRRTFEELEETQKFEIVVAGSLDESAEATGESPLEGLTVVFRRDGPDDEAQASLAAESEGETAVIEPLLAGLVEDMDLRGFLPPAEHDLEERWDVGADAYGALFAPGGELALEYDQAGPWSELEGEPQLTGAAWARLAELVEAEESAEGPGRRLARIELGGELEIRSERPTELEHIPVTQGRATERVRIALELEGFLLWDLAAGRFAALEVEAATRMEIETVRDPGQEGPDFTSTVVLAGTWELEAQASPR